METNLIDFEWGSVRIVTLKKQKVMNIHAITKSTSTNFPEDSKSNSPRNGEQYINDSDFPIGSPF